jgi:manganese/zinc/iron transport system permease protein
LGDIAEVLTRDQIVHSVAFATLSAVLGYVFASYGPLWFGAQNAVSAAGMIATVSGIVLALTAVFGPHRKGAVGQA